MSIAMQIGVLTGIVLALTLAFYICNKLSVYKEKELVKEHMNRLKLFDEMQKKIKKETNPLGISLENFIEDISSISPKYHKYVLDSIARAKAATTRDKGRERFIKEFIVKHIPESYMADGNGHNPCPYQPMYEYLFYLRFKDQINCKPLTDSYDNLNTDCYCFWKHYFETRDPNCEHIDTCYKVYVLNHPNNSMSQVQFYVEVCKVPQLNLALSRVMNVKYEDLDLKTLKERTS